MHSLSALLDCNVKSENNNIMGALYLMRRFVSQHTGPVPPNLCQNGRSSSVVFLSLVSNQLTGSLDISQCGSLSYIDATVGRPLLLYLTHVLINHIHLCAS